MQHGDKGNVNRMVRKISLGLNLLTIAVGMWAASECYDFGDFEFDFDWPESFVALLLFALVLFARVWVFNRDRTRAIAAGFAGSFLKNGSRHPDLQPQGMVQDRANGIREGWPQMLEGLCSFSASRNFEINSSNDVFSELVGYTKEELTVKKQTDFAQLIVPEERERFREDVLHISLEGGNRNTSYHINCKDGRIILVSAYMKAVRDSRGKMWIQAIFIRINEQTDAYEELQKNANRSEILLSQLTDIIFEINVEEDAVTYSMNWEDKIAADIPRSRALERIKEGGIFHPDDAGLIEQMLLDCRQDALLREQKVRLYGKDERYIWCIMKLCGVKDQSGKVVQLIGTIKDCDKESVEMEALRQKAEIDELTGLYNKYTIQEKIKSYLIGKRNSERGLMFIIDMDNFKQVNDTYGHYTGDLVLEQTGRILKEFSEQYGGDAGRIGGDEFVVFLYAVSDADEVSTRINELRDILKIEIPGTDKLFSGSIGAALTESEDSFESAYMRVDSMLYQEKKRSKV